MKTNIIYIFLITFLTFGISLNGTAFADMDAPDRPPTKEQRERVKKRIETMRMWKLTKALDLDEETAARVFPLMNKYDQKRAELEEALRDGMKDLRDTLRDKREGGLRTLIDELREKHRELQNLMDREFEELSHILTIEQQAKFVIFIEEFKREIGKIIRDVRSKKHRKLRDDTPPSVE